MTHNFQNEFEDIVLKPLEQKNIEDLRNLRNKEENRKLFYISERNNKRRTGNWYKKYLEKKKNVMFSAFLKENEEYPVGLQLFMILIKIVKNANLGE